MLEYNLIFGTHHFYVLMRQFYTVYERIMKAKQIIESKVDEDLGHRDDEELKKRVNEFKKERFELFLAGATLAL